MDKLEVRHTEHGALFVINGTSLLDLVRRNTAASGKKPLAYQEVSDGGLDVYYFDNAYGKPDGYEAAVLICECGTKGCGDVDATIIIGENKVVWRDIWPRVLRTPLANMGPFCFDLSQYASALSVDLADYS